MRIKILNRREYEPSRTPLKSFSVFKFSKKILLFLSVEHTKMSLNFTLTLTLKGCLMPFNVSCLIIRLLRLSVFRVVLLEAVKLCMKTHAAHSKNLLLYNHLLFMMHRYLKLSVAVSLSL